MSKVVPLRCVTVFKKAFGDSEVFSRFASDVLGVDVTIDRIEVCEDDATIDHNSEGESYRERGQNLYLRGSIAEGHLRGP